MNANIATPGMCLSAGARFATKLGSISASHDLVDAFLKEGDSHSFYQVILEHFTPKASKTQSLTPWVAAALANWGDFYQKFFGIDLDVTAIRIPEKVDGFDRLIVVAKGIRLNQVWNAHEEREIRTWKWWSGSLEKAMQESERGPVKESYAFWVRDVQEADEEMKNLSAQMIADSPKKIDTETLLERLVHGLKFWDEIEKQLDVNNITLCASSRYADGAVPEVYWRDDNVLVRGYYPSYRNPYLRARQAVR